jgi:uncharacterized membrane protein YgdD (TMEM256/DUF423 family)
MERTIFSLGAFLGGLAVAAGAFGAHALKSRVAADTLAIWDTAARYQMFHALALLGLAWAVTRWPGAGLNATAWLWLVGVLLFSGSLYLLVLTGHRWLGAVTPIGGVALIAGWAWAAFRVATVS